MNQVHDALEVLSPFSTGARGGVFSIFRKTGFPNTIKLMRQGDSGDGIKY